jgi:hypothetical protein
VSSVKRCDAATRAARCSRQSEARSRARLSARYSRVGPKLERKARVRKGIRKSSVRRWRSRVGCWLVSTRFFSRALLTLRNSCFTFGSLGISAFATGSLRNWSVAILRGTSGHEASTRLKTLFAAALSRRFAPPREGGERHQVMAVDQFGERLDRLAPEGPQVLSGVHCTAVQTQGSNFIRRLVASRQRRANRERPPAARRIVSHPARQDASKEPLSVSPAP